MSTSGISYSYKGEVLAGAHSSTHTYKIALYNAAAISPADTTYTTTGEVSGAGYLPGGLELIGLALGTMGQWGYVQFDQPIWPGSTLTADAAMIYNSHNGSNRAVGVVTFDPISTVGATLRVELGSGTVTEVITFTPTAITRTSGSFIADGFVTGNTVITTDLVNPGPFVLTSVSATQMECVGLTVGGPLLTTIKSPVLYW